MNLAASWSIAADGTVRRRDADAAIVSLQVSRDGQVLDDVCSLLEVPMYLAFGWTPQTVAPPPGEVVWMGLVATDRIVFVAWDLRGLPAVLVAPDADPRLLDLCAGVTGLTSRPSTPAQVLTALTATPFDGRRGRFRAAKGRDALEIAASGLASYLATTEVMTGSDGGFAVCDWVLCERPTRITVGPATSEHRRHAGAQAAVLAAWEVDTFGSRTDADRRRRGDLTSWETLNPARHRIEDDKLDPTFDTVVELLLEHDAALSDVVLDVLARYLTPRQLQAYLLDLDGHSDTAIGLALGIDRRAASRLVQRAATTLHEDMTHPDVLYVWEALNRPAQEAG